MPKLVSPTGKPIALKPVHPNAGIQAKYRQKMLTLIDEMNNSILYWVSATYKANEPEALAQDASPAKELRKTMKKMTKRWQSKFDAGADNLAEWFAQKTKDYADGTLKGILKDAGFSVEFKMTAPMQDAYDAVIFENVGLIRSIAAKNLTNVETMVMQSVQLGRDLGTLTDSLQKTFGVTRRRAALISRDQCNKATATITKTRQLGLGITQAKWRHSSAGKEPRPEHVHFDGELYDVAQGMWSKVDGQYVWPGTAINCLPGESVIEFAAGCKKLWRRRYRGDLTEIVTASGKTVKATPNHPILTGRGWLPMKSVNVGDDVLCIGKQIVNIVEPDVQRSPAEFADIFNSIASYIAPVSRFSGFEFHGDIADGEVETIDVDGFLGSELDAAACKEIAELFFAEANHVLIGAGFSADSTLYAASSRLFCAPESVISGFSTLLPLLKGHGSSADDACLRLTADFNAAANQAKSNASAGCIVALGKLKLADAGLVIGDDQIIGELIAILSRGARLWNSDTPGADFLGDQVGTSPDNLRGASEGIPRGYELDSVVDKRVFEFSGHVYNLENELNWYSSATVIVHNCRCTSAPIITGFID